MKETRQRMTQHIDEHACLRLGHVLAKEHETLDELYQRVIKNKQACCDCRDVNLIDADYYVIWTSEAFKVVSYDGKLFSNRDEPIVIFGSCGIFDKILKESLSKACDLIMSSDLEI